jgi:hypothetical protein
MQLGSSGPPFVLGVGQQQDGGAGMLVGTDGAGSDRIRRLDGLPFNNRRTFGVGGRPGMIASGLVTVCERNISPNSGEKFSRELAYFGAANILRCGRAARPTTLKFSDPPPPP